MCRQCQVMKDKIDQGCTASRENQSRFFSNPVVQVVIILLLVNAVVVIAGIASTYVGTTP